MRVRFVPATLNMRRGTVRFLIPVPYWSPGFIIDGVVEADLEFDPDLKSITVSGKSYQGALVITEEPLKILLKEKSFGIALQEGDLLEVTSTGLILFDSRAPPYMIMSGEGPGFEKDFPDRSRINIIEFSKDSIIIVSFPTKAEEGYSIPVSVRVFSPSVPTTWKIMGYWVDDYKVIMKILLSILYYRPWDA